MSENTHSFAHNVQKVVTSIPNELNRTSAMWGIATTISELQHAIDKDQSAYDISLDINELLIFCQREIKKIQLSQQRRQALISAVNMKALERV